MSTTTSNLGLFKYDTTNPTDLASAFNINQALNNNWDIIDNAITHVDGLPDQTDKDGYLLTTDGNEASWGETGEIFPVIETYQNGTSWYRVYSDGWCEQGGQANTGATYNVVFLKEYSDTNYTVSLAHVTTIAGSGTTDAASLIRNGLKTTGFTIYQYSSNVKTNWRACGYIEV